MRRTTTRVDVVEHIGVSFNNPVLWDWKSQELFSVGYDSLSDLVKEDKVKEDVNQAFLADLFFIKRTTSQSLVTSLPRQSSP
jgi:hypothetical protein